MNHGLELDRRALLAFGGAGALCLIGDTAPREPAMAQQAFRYVVTDRRQGESLAFGRTFADAGAVRLEITEGLTEIWKGTLRPHWRDAIGAVVGLTSAEIWHCIAEQARSEARKSMLLGHHRLELQFGAVTHAVIEPRLAPSETMSIEQRDHYAPPLDIARLARLCAVNACGVEWRKRSPSPAAAGSRSLFSWIVM